MVIHIKQPSIITAEGNKPKLIEEFIGRVNSATDKISIAKMQSPAGWEEPGQTPEFDEYTIVLKGALHVRTKEEEFIIEAGQAVITQKGEWIQYRTPDQDTEYIAVCLPAFSPTTVNRDFL